MTSLKNIEDYLCSDRAQDILARNFDDVCSSHKMSFWSLFPLQYLQDEQWQNYEDDQWAKFDHLFTLEYVVVYMKDPLFTLDGFLNTLRRENHIDIPGSVIDALDKLFEDEIMFHKEEYMRDGRHSAHDKSTGVPMEKYELAISYIDERQQRIPSSRHIVDYVSLNAWRLSQLYSYCHSMFNCTMSAAYDEIMYRIERRDHKPEMTTQRSSFIANILTAQSVWHKRMHLNKLSMIIGLVHRWKRQLQVRT
jgi:hypothetical protein